MNMKSLCRAMAASISSLLAVAIPGISQTPDVTAFVNVSVVPMDRERVLIKQTVLVQGGRIVAIGSADRVHVPAGAVRIDGHGKFLIPGLADMHVHLGYPMEMQDSNMTERMLFFYVANGITTVRDMHSGLNPRTPNRGLALKELVATGKLIGPRIYTAGDPDKQSPEAAAKTTATLKSAGYDFVKIEDVDRTLFDSIVAAAHRTGLRIVGHVPEPMDSELTLAFRAQYSSIEHVTGYKEDLFGPRSGRWAGHGIEALTPLADTAVWMQPNYHLDSLRLHDLAIATKRAGIWNCPTLVYIDLILNRGIGALANKTADSAALAKSPYGRIMHRWHELDFQVVRALHKAGAPILAGTDQMDTDDDINVPPGFAIHRELALLVQAGLTPYQALETATRNVAVFLGTTDSSGTVTVGRRADLVLLGENPLKDIGAITSLAGVMVGGRWLTRVAIDAQLDAWRTYPRSFQKTPYDLTAVRNALWREPTPR